MKWLMMIAVVGMVGCFDEDVGRNQKVVNVLESVGFTHQQALLLRFGPLGSVSLCLGNGFPEKTCWFFATDISLFSSHKNDYDYYSECKDAGLTKDQCTLLRVGVDEWRKSHEF